MNRWVRLVPLGAVLCSGLAGWQAGLGAIGVKDSEMPAIAKAYLLSGSDPQLPGYDALAGAMRTLWKSKGGAERAQEIRALAAYAKQFVSTAAFQTMYSEWIKQRYNAVDHGLKPRQGQPSAAELQATARAAMSQMGAAMANSMKGIPPQALRTLFDNDLQSWKDDTEKASLYARAQKIVPLFNTNPEEWKRQYILLKSESLGGPANDAASDKAMADLKQRSEQQAYDQYNLKTVLRKRLQDFIALARSVDFNAQMQPQGKLQAFANADYEKKPAVWKELYRLGREPTTAAAAAAEQWLKELN